MTLFSSVNRKETLKTFSSNKLDLFVIGGGITGAGIALDAVRRGLTVGLIDMQDFAAGTSSRSTKLVHGGLRYLQQFEIGLVAEVGKERAIVYENGPHVTTPEWMMLPFYKKGNFGPFTTNIGLRVYDFLAGVKKSERRKMLKPEEALAREPLLKETELKGAGYYVEYKTDDARLTMEVLKKAVETGAQALNYIEALDFVYNAAGKVHGVRVQDRITGETETIHAEKIINATGPWVDHLREKNGFENEKRLFLAKGSHIVFEQERFPLEQAIYFDAPDERMIFAIPRDGKTYVGTTDTPFEANLEHPNASIEDVQYLLDAANHTFPSLKLTPSDVHSSWAGVRPLIAQEGKNPDEISRKDEIFISETGLISMAGGKLTGYRKMAEDVVGLVVKQLKEEKGIIYSESDTKHVPLSGGDVGGSVGFATFKEEKVVKGIALGLKEDEANRLVQRYGSNIDVLYDLFVKNKQEAHMEQIDPVVFAELSYAIHYESAYKPVDFFIRRTGALFFNIDWINEHKENVNAYLAKVLEWTDDETEQYSKELEREIYAAEMA